jgi:ribosome biogenesis GTPase
MAKRNLNRRQQWRIEKIQKERTERATRKDQLVSEKEVSGELGKPQQGLLITHFGKQVELEALEGELSGNRFRCHIRANLGALVTGDRVVWRPGICTSSDQEPTGVIEAVHERKSLLQRPDIYGQLRPVAANIDHLIIVIAPEPEPFDNLIDRYIVAAETLSIPPVILLNKTDLITEENILRIDELTQQYDALGYTLLRANCYKGQEGIEELIHWLDQQTCVFVGQSGVGKSSLIQALLPDEYLKVGALSEARKKGTHTTTTARLFHLPEGGDMIDSPGIREFGLWHISEEELIEGFVEFRPFLGHCKFRDCKHQQEPGCAIQQALESGAISEKRMRSFEMIKASLNDVTTHNNAKGH